VAKWIADILLIAVAAFVGYQICIAVEREQIARMIFVTALMMGLLATMQDLAPVIERWGQRIDSLQSTAEKIANVGQGNWKIPMSGDISQYYKGEDHHGIDIAANEGTPVYSSNKGEVVKVGWHDIYGNMIIVDHGGGVQTLYGHLSGLYVKEGYPVIAGTKLGACGNTGNSSGPHLHFEIRKNGTCVDPLTFLK
jgi:murein DD-endopeptidase MepM/ murein hydrolase activator NlpD